MLEDGQLATGRAELPECFKGGDVRIRVDVMEDAADEGKVKNDRNQVLLFGGNKEG